MSSEHKNNIIELHIDIAKQHIEQNLTALDLLAAESQLSKQKLKDAMTKGAVWLSPSADSNTAKPVRRKNAKLKAGNQIHLYYNPEILAQAALTPELIADEGDYSVWNKPYGVWSHGSKWGDHCSIGRLVEQYFEFARQSYLVHRLDRAANGLIVIAHNKKAARLLSEMFANREIEKTYRATVSGQLSQNQKIDTPIDDKQAISHVSLIEYHKTANQSFVEIKIETGRKHQIRKHLANIGHPIIGDRLYGSADKSTVDLQLTAYELNFNCPLQECKKHYQL